MNKKESFKSLATGYESNKSTPMLCLYKMKMSLYNAFQKNIKLTFTNNLRIF
ncbi:hypothetical protein HanPSC8_Chr08g0315761 [Helianthus annuus]|nr:hypothetical protein HanPSC8_Chr08g0315761 [Helianthus annuus]